MGVAKVKSPAAGFTGALKNLSGLVGVRILILLVIHEEKLDPRCNLIQIHLKFRVKCRLPILVRSPFSLSVQQLFWTGRVREGQITRPMSMFGLEIPARPRSAELN